MRVRIPSLILMPLETKHGTRTGYVHYKCRCDSCRKAQRDYERTRLQLRRKPRVPINEIKENDLYWLAGLLEGEGSFTIKANKISVCISVEMTDKDIIERAANIVGKGNIYYCKARKSNYKSSWKWNLTYPTDCFKLMNLLIPLMGERRSAKIKECLVVVAQ